MEAQDVQAEQEAPQVAETEQQPEMKQESSQRVQVSSSKKPTHYYVNLCKRKLAEHGQVQLSALGQAVSVCVTVAEILKNSNLATVTKIQTSMEYPQEMQRASSKPKLQIFIEKSDDFEAVMEKQEQERAERLARLAEAQAEAAAASKVEHENDVGAVENGEVEQPNGVE